MSSGFCRVMNRTTGWSERMTSHQAWFLGIDLGTGSCKTIALDVSGKVLGHGAADYQAAAPAGRWGEQEPEALVKAAIQAARQVSEKFGLSPEGCRAFSIGGAFHSLIALDEAGQPLTGAITWIDERAVQQAQDARKSGMGESLYRQTGCPAHSMYPLYKLAWLRQEQPGIFRKASRFVSAKEYLTARLTGKYFVDYAIASGSGLLDTHTLDWCPQALEYAGVQPEQLSALIDPRQPVHGLRADLAEAMGISKDSLFVAGSADAPNSSIGAGAVLPGQATCMIGTSGALRIISPRPLIDPQGRIWCYAIDPGHWLVGGAINNGGLALSWWREMLNNGLKHIPGSPEYSFEKLVELASEIPAGSEDLICLPFFAGERSPYWNMQARGVFFGLKLHHGLGHMTRALLEGVAFRLRSIQVALEDVAGGIKEIYTSGGLARSPVWLQIMASILNHPLLVPVEGETSSLGAAYWAMRGAGLVKDLEQASQLFRAASTCQPDQADAALYNSYFDIYSQLYFALGEAFEKMSQVGASPPAS